MSQTDVSYNALHVMERLNEAGYGAYLVGGGVRDLLLRHVPKDFDIATDARPNQVRKLFRNCRLIGRRFRLAHILFGREIIEVATFRGPTNHAQDGMIVQDNTYGNIHEDAWRRDFTINALYYNHADSSIIDFTGGFTDLQTNTLRLIGEPNKRYQEDPVRMLRAIRFSAKLGFTIHTDTAKPITVLAQQLRLISPARLFEEVLKLYHCGQGERVQALLIEYGLFDILFPQTAAALNHTPQAAVFIQSVLHSTDQRIAANKPITPAFLFAAMLWHPVQAITQQASDVPPAEAFQQAMHTVLQKQFKHTHIPRRLTQVVREIWQLQYRLLKQTGSHPLRTLKHPRFRAGYDFLVLRAAVGEVKPELADWWTQFQLCDEQQQKEMIKKCQNQQQRFAKRRQKRKPQSKP